MERTLTITYDDSDLDMPALAVFDHVGRKITMLNGIMGDRATQIYNYLIGEDEYRRFTALPVGIGDTVFFISTWRMEVERGKVSMLQQKADGTWKMRITEGSSVFDRPMTDIGIKVFLTEADAEMALNEMRIGLGEHSGDRT